MKTMTSRHSSMIAIFMSILLAVVLSATGCATKVVPTESPQISMMVETNFTSSEYDAGALLLWNIGQSTLQTSGTSVVHVTDFDNGGLPLYWQLGSPVRVVQQWNYLSKKSLVATISKDVNLLAPPEGMQYLSTKDSEIRRWYVPEENVFVSIPLELDALLNETLDGKTLTITEQSISSGSKAQTLTVPIPSALTQIVVVYGSGSINNGFVLVEAADKVVKNMSDGIWLLRMSDGKATWIRCGNRAAFTEGFISGQWANFARVGSLLYFTHSHNGQIGCIDTAAALPSITLPEKINILLPQLYSKGPTSEQTVGPLQAQLVSDNGMLIIEYPDANWNALYYAVDAAGTVLGSLRSDKTSITSFDAKGKQGSSIPTPGSISFPSIDLFQ